MSNSLKPEAFRESVYRCFPGVKTDPFLAGRIIASEKGETKVKKKVSFSLAFVLLILFVLAAAACAGTVIYREVNWKGEPIETEAPDWPEIRTPEEDENIAVMDQLTEEVPEGDYSYTQYDGPDFRQVHEHYKQKNFTSFEEFRQYMADWDYLTVPAWLPEDVKTVSAKVILQSKVNPEKDTPDWETMDDGNEDQDAEPDAELPEEMAFETDVPMEEPEMIEAEPESDEESESDVAWDYEEEEENGWEDDFAGGYFTKVEDLYTGKDDKVHFTRYTLDDADAVVTGYQLTLGFNGRPDIRIFSELDTSIGESTFRLSEEETADTPHVKGMGDALLISSPSEEIKERLFLTRYLTKPVEYSEVWALARRTNRESITVLAYDRTPEEMIRIITGE